MTIIKYNMVGIKNKKISFPSAEVVNINIKKKMNKKGRALRYDGELTTSEGA